MESKAVGAARKKYEIEIEGRKVGLSNLDKVLYPSGFTKGQVIDFYVRMAEFVLPHLKGRPITLKRYPDGINAPHFYEKDAPRYTPEWVRTFNVPRREGGTIRYIVIDDLPTLVWCANTANLELHPFLHKAPQIDRPTAVAFDLDPGEGTDVLTCAQVAFRLKEVFDAAGLASFAKVSGSKGMQVYVPLNTAVTYEQTQPFAKSLAERMEREHPDCVVPEMAKSKRTGKVFIDWSQNSDFKTTVAVYSLRAKRAEPYVSMPVTWEELARAIKKKDASSLQFDPEAALARLEKRGDLWADVLTLKQKLPRERKVSAATPKFIEPMRAALADKLPEGAAWQYEVKFDGYRALAVKNGGEVELLSRNNLKLNSRFPQIAKALASLPDGTVLDGEVVAVDAQGRPVFNALQNSQKTSHPIYYYVFDLLYDRGRSLMDQPLRERRARLEKLKLTDPARVSQALEASAADLAQAAKEQGLEGLVAKRLNSIYEPGARSGAWVKYKVNQGQELVIGGYMPGPQGFTSLLVGYYDERGKLIFIAKVKNGFVPRTRKDVAARFKGLGTDACPFDNLPEPKNARRGEALTAEVMKKCCWLKPELVAQVEYTDWTSANHLRHSRFAGLRDDKKAREVVRESAA
jgi:bifunctional non-homologous end joining protein LigD